MSARTQTADKRRLLVIEVLPHALRVAEVGPGPSLLQKLEFPGGLAEGTAPETTGASLKAFLQSSSIRTRECIAVLPAQWVATARFESPELAEEDARALELLEAEKSFPYPTGEMALGRWRTNLSGSTQVLLAGIASSRLRAVETLCRAGGLRLRAVVPKGAFAAPPGASLLQDDAGLVLRIAGGDGMILLRSLGEADPLSRWDDDNRLRDLAREIKLATRSIPSTLGIATGLMVCAPPASAARLTEALRRTGIPAEERAIDPNAEPLALAAALWRHGSVELNLLPPRPTRLELLTRAVGQRALLTRGLPAAGALVALMALVFILRGWWAGHLERRWAAISPDVAKVESFEKDIRAWRAWYQPSAPTLDLMKALTEAFPPAGDVYSKTLQIRDLRFVTCTGEARRREDFARFQERLGATKGVSGLQVQQLRGEGPVEFRITFEWKRGQS